MTYMHPRTTYFRAVIIDLAFTLPYSRGRC